MDDLVTALRNPDKPLAPYALWPLGSLCREAANRIESLQSDKERMREALLLVRKIAEPLIQVDDVWEDATHIVSCIDRCLTTTDEATGPLSRTDTQ